MKRLFFVVALMGCAPDAEQSCEDRCNEQVEDYADAILEDCVGDSCISTLLTGNICPELCEEHDDCLTVCEAATFERYFAMLDICLLMYNVNECLWLNVPSMWEFCESTC